jgi:4,5:9,10-diseco-3-hydroxy-5,9,17-trioxoandrosta-1(10),2-diene-4-oate hydrolase
MRKALLAFVFLLALVYTGLRLYDRPPAAPGGWLDRLRLEERFATLDGLRIRYVRTGKGPPLLLMHGFGSSIYTWKDVIPALAQHREVVAFDWPGFGWSDQPEDLSFDLFPRVALAFLDQFGWERAALAGNSMGGAVAAVVAAHHPSRVDRLVLIDAAGFNLRAAEAPVMVRLTMHPLAARLLPLVPVKRLAVTRGLLQVFHDDAKVTPERVDEYLAAAARPGTLASIRSLGASQRLDPQAFETLLRRITAPTLVLWGGDDTWIPVAHADRFVAAIPGARKAVLPGVGHTPEEEAPEEVSRLLLEFLQVDPS